MERIWRVKFTLSLVPLIALLGCAPSFQQTALNAAAPMRVASWNIEHFGAVGEGCVPRSKAQIAEIKSYIDGLGAEVVSFQEVASKDAAEAIFPSNQWQLFVSNRVYQAPQPQCRQDRSRTMGHMRTGFAVRRGIVVEKQPELSSLGDTVFGTNQEPYGVDLLVNLQGKRVRMLSLHLTSGCSISQTLESPACRSLYSQAPALRAWIEQRYAAGETWLLAGDFNRHWQMNDTFWGKALGQHGQGAQIISNGSNAVDLLILSTPDQGLRLEHVASGRSAVASRLSDHEPVIANFR